MNSVFTVVCLLIIGGLVVILILQKDGGSEDYWRGGWRRPGWARGIGWAYRRPWINNYPYYPQSLVTETCLNECCDYDKCVQGLGCNWKGLDNRWHVGNSTECLAYRNCVNNSTKPENERHLECSAKAARA